MEKFGNFCYAIIILFLSSLISGYVFLKLYEWFVITIFHTPVIRLSQAIGLSLFLSIIKPKIKMDGETPTIEKLNKQFGDLIVSALFVLGMGQIILQFI